MPKSTGGESSPGGDGPEPWDRLLADARPRDHIVQLYQDTEFLSRAVCRFAGGAIANGEGVILVPTRSHWDALRPRLEAAGVDVEAAQASGQLWVIDADEFLPTFMQDGMPDSPVFMGLASDVIRRARASRGGQRVRWWGEMVNVLWEGGHVTASMKLENLFDQLAEEQDVAIFCSFLMDNFDGHVHADVLPVLGAGHSHLVPVEHYLRLERAVSDALREAVGPDEVPGLEEQLIAASDQALETPRGQALLMALRHVIPHAADPVLRRSGELYHAAGPPS